MSRSILTLSGSLFLLTVVTAANTATQDDPPVLAGGDLLEHMEGLKKNLKGLATALQGSDDESSLARIADMQSLVLLAKLESPPNLDEQPEDERGAHRADFRKDLARLLQELAGMEIEILEGEPEKAFGRVMDSLYHLREGAHARYRLKR